MSKISLLDEITDFDAAHQAVIWKPGMVKPGRGSLDSLVATLAAPHVSAAALSAALAAASAETAAFNRKIYADTALGLAATAAGDYFFTPGTGEDDFLIQWKHEGDGTASEVARSPSTGILSTLFAARDAAIAAGDLASAKAALADIATLAANGKAALADTAAAAATAAADEARNAVASLLNDPYYFTAIEGQTAFELPVVPAARVEVWKNGLRLPQSAHTKVGRFISLSEPCEVDDDIIIDVTFSRVVPAVAAANIDGLMALLDARAERTTVISLTDQAFGAVGDGVNDDTGAIRGALNFLRAKGGGALFIPPNHEFRISDAVAALGIPSNTLIFGGGDTSVIFCDCRPTNPRRDFLLLNGVEDVELRGFWIRGTVHDYPNQTNAGHLVTGADVKRVRVRDMRFSGSRMCSFAIAGVEDASCTGSTFEDGMGDGFRCLQARNVRVANNNFRRIVDDSVSLHSRDDTSENVPASALLPHNLVVEGNTFDTGQGVRVLGAKMLNIRGNTFVNMMRSPIEIMSEYDDIPEGNTNMFAIDVCDNIFMDTLSDRNTTFVIRVQIRNRAKGALAKQPGALAPIFDNAWDNNIDVAGSVSIGGIAINITGNTIGWSRKRGVLFSSYGKGVILDRYGSGREGFTDQDITEESYAATGIWIDGPVRALRICDNMLFGGGRSTAAHRPAIHMTSDASAANSLVAELVKIEGNIITDWIGGRGILLDHQTLNGARSVSVNRNSFDLDPFFRHPAHNADGTWSDPDGLIAIDNMGRQYNGTLEGNEFKNVSRMILSGVQFLYGENTVFYQPGGAIGLDDEPLNKGVRVVPASPKFRCVIIDGNPASATFGTTVSFPRRHASAMPTSGTYVYGHVVMAATPIIGGSAGSRYIVTGWLRLTTGSAHVLNTDWVELRSFTGA